MSSSQESLFQNCPICGSKKFISILKLKDYSISQENFSLKSCTKCNFLITHPQPKLKQLAQYYKSESYISHSATRKGIINKLYHRVQQNNLKRKFNAVKKYVPRGTWMDYGAGNGAFLKYLINQKIKVEGFEPDEGARKIAKERGVDIKNSNLYQKGNNNYVAITMWHVLEHIPNLNEILELHYSNLVEGGKLVIAVPNYRSYDAGYYKKYWAAYDVPRHLWHFDEERLIELLSKHNFTHIKTAPMIFDSFYVSMLSEKYKKGFLARGVLIGAISNLKAALKQHPYSSQIYVFEKKPI